MKRKSKVTFFYSRIEEKQIFYSLASELKRKNFNVDFSTNLKKKSEIGFYCQSNSDPSNSKISAIFLGGIDQGRIDWPNIWEKQPWEKFDLGFLPGDNWAKRWKRSSHHKKSKTKYGVFKVGWPKADYLFDKKDSKNQLLRFQKKYNIKKRQINILYAPSFECFDRQLDVVRSVKKLGYNLIIKHWLIKREKRYIDLWDNILKSNKETLKIYKVKSKIIKPQENFLNILNFVDLLITDESSVAYEALIKDIPTISVRDWQIQRHKKGVTRNVKPANITIKTTKQQLSKCIYQLINRNKKN